MKFEKLIWIKLTWQEDAHDLLDWEEGDGQ